MSEAGLPARVTPTYSQQYRRCGKPTCSVCKPGAPGHGPYWYAYWWEGDRMRSRYIGKRAPAMGMTAEAPSMEGRAALPTASVERPPALHVQTLGGFAARRGQLLIAPERWRRRKATDLFKCLLSSPGQRLHREQAIDLLWPDAGPTEGAHSLRSTLHILRQVLDEPAGDRRRRRSAASYVRLDGDWLVLAPALAGEPPADWLDALAFERAAAEALAGHDIAGCRRAVALYGGEYLPEVVYEEWAVLRRQALRQQYATLLLHLADLSIANGELEEAERSFEALLAVDPCHEAAAQGLMGLLAGSGRRTKALQIYQALIAALRSQLGVGPSTETEAFHRRLLTQEAAPLARDFPPRSTMPQRPTNLPASLTSFVGRERERAALRGILGTRPPGCRLLTLTGAGGCGKTRLALEVAGDLLPQLPDGVWLVELAAMTDPALVPQAVAQVLGVREEPDRPLPATLADFLAPRHLLLVLDNCEHLVAACAGLAAFLLEACAGLQILATSREALAVAGEVPWRVPSLALSASAHLLPLEELAQCDAVRLFLERGRVSRPDFALTALNASTVVQICRRLDGIPLAIELAAARLSLFSVESLAARLDDRFRLLTGGSRTAPPRQQTLRAAMDWSYALLTEPERVLLRRLAVFAGSWTPDAAEAICTDPTASVLPSQSAAQRESRAVQAPQAPDSLHRLVAKSLVVAGVQDGEARCWLLETVRQYAGEQLAASGEESRVRRRHHDRYLALAEEATAAWQGAEQATWLARLEREHDNLRAALAWCVQQADAAAALRMATALRWLWEVHGHLSEGRRWLEIALGTPSAVPPAVRATALTGAGRLAELQGDYAQAAVWYEESLALWRTLDDRRGIANALIGLGVVRACQGQLEQADELFEGSLAIDRGLGYTEGMIVSLNNQGGVAYYLRDFERAKARFEESLALSRSLGDKRSMARALNNRAELARNTGEHDRAAPWFRECLQLYAELDDKQGIAMALEGIAGALAANGRAELAAKLCGAAQGLRAASGVPLTPQERATFERDLDNIGALLGQERSAASREVGRTMPLEQAIAYAVAAADAAFPGESRGRS